VFISIVVGIISVVLYMGEQSTAPAALDKHNFWYSFGIFSPEAYMKLPNSLVIITLISNFGTFVLYMTTCAIAMVAFQEHHTFNGFKHVFIPMFGLLANLACMLFYLIGPFMVSGMSWKEPYIALGVAFVWGLYGLFYFWKRSAVLSRPMLLKEKPA